MQINQLGILSRFTGIEIEVHLFFIESSPCEVAVVEDVQLIISWSENVISGVLIGIDF